MRRPEKQEAVKTAGYPAPSQSSGNSGEVEEATKGPDPDDAIDESAFTPVHFVQGVGLVADEKEPPAEGKGGRCETCHGTKTVLDLDTCGCCSTERRCPDCKGTGQKPEPVATPEPVTGETWEVQGVADMGGERAWKTAVVRNVLPPSSARTVTEYVIAAHSFETIVGRDKLVRRVEAVATPEPEREGGEEILSVCPPCSPDCECGAYRHVVCLPLAGVVRTIDSCIHKIVAALNAGGVETVASCCGHGKRQGVITLEDGRELVIRPYDERNHMSKEAGFQAGLRAKDSR